MRLALGLCCVCIRGRVGYEVVSEGRAFVGLALSIKLCVQHSHLKQGRLLRPNVCLERRETHNTNKVEAKEHH